jgi:hypothetical protein
MDPAAAGGIIPAMPRRDPVRLLGKTGGTTTDPARALRDGHRVEPEAVPADYQEQLTRAAHRDQQQARVARRIDRSQQDLARRITFAQQQAKHIGVDVHNAMRLLKLSIAAGRSEAAVLRRVEALERLVFPDLPG